MKGVNLKDSNYLKPITSLNIVIESVIAKIKENSDAETKAFLKEFCKVYEYYSFRSIGLKKEDKEKLNEAFSKLRTSMNKIKTAYKHLDELNQLNQLRRIVYLRTNDALLLQEELGYLKKKRMFRFQLVMELLNTNKEKIEEFNYEETSNISILNMKISKRFISIRARLSWKDCE